MVLGYGLWQRPLRGRSIDCGGQNRSCSARGLHVVRRHAEGFPFLTDHSGSWSAQFYPPVAKHMNDHERIASPSRPSLAQTGNHVAECTSRSRPSSSGSGKAIPQRLCQHRGTRVKLQDDKPANLRPTLLVLLSAVAFPGADRFANIAH